MENKNYGKVDSTELARLERQANLIYKYIDGQDVRSLIAKLLSKRSPLRVLDLGCANGNSFFKRADGFQDRIIYTGVDSSATALEELNKNLSKRYDSCFLLNANVEDENFKEQMQSQKISKFDFIDISSLLLLLKNPEKVLAVVKDLLNKDGGQLFILDIDDRNTHWNCSNPQKAKYYDELYGRAMEICLNGKTTGNRHSGRNILTMLENVGFKHGAILNGTNDEVHGLNTKDMPDEDKVAFADMLFGFIKRTVDQPDTDKETKQWFDANLNALKQGFLDPDLTFSLGYMTFIASNSKLLLSPSQDKQKDMGLENA